VASTDLGFKHLEADTMLLSAYAKLMADNNKEVVILDSEDRRVCASSICLTSTSRKLLIKHKKEYISCSAMLSDDVANIIIPVHVITGSDHTSAFFGHGKNVLQKVIRLVIQRKGNSLNRCVGDELRDEVKAAMKTFVLSCIVRMQVLLVGRPGCPGGIK